MTDEVRHEIAKLLTGRCNNCYRQLPGYDVHGKGWNWITPNLGPFCDDCYAETTKVKEGRDEAQR